MQRCMEKGGNKSRKSKILAIASDLMLFIRIDVVILVGRFLQPEFTGAHPLVST